MDRRRATDDDYAEMAASYEVEPPRRDEVLWTEIGPALPKGRPPKGGAARGRTPLTTVRLPDSVRDELVRRAEAAGSSASELIRRAVVEYLDRHPA